MNPYIYVGLRQPMKLEFLQALDKPIIRIVSDITGISVDDIKSKRRIRTIVEARCLAIYFLRTKNRNTYQKIGELVGGRDHSTIIYNLSLYEILMAQNEGFKSMSEKVAKKLDEG